MRLALAVAVSAAWLFASAVQASTPETGDEAALSLAASSIGRELTTTASIGDSIRVAVEYSAPAMSGALSGRSGPLRLVSSALNYFPFENGVHLAFAMQRDKLAKAEMRGFSGRGRRLFSTGLNRGFGAKPKLLPSAMLGYALPLGSTSAFNIEGGMRSARRPGSFLLTQSRNVDRVNPFGATGPRFGPSVRLSFSHSF